MGFDNLRFADTATPCDNDRSAGGKRSPSAPTQICYHLRKNVAAQEQPTHLVSHTGAPFVMKPDMGDSTVISAAHVITTPR